MPKRIAPYLLPGADLAVSSSATTWHSYIMADGAAIAEVQNNLRTGSTTRIVIGLYYFLDGQNSVSDVTSGTGTAPNGTGGAPEIDACQAWGQHRRANGIDAGVNPITSIARRGTLSQDQTVSNALVHLNARYYDASLARFMGTDPMVGSNPYDLQNWNTYSYAGNNPLAFSDPTGMCQGVFGCIGEGFTDLFHDVSSLIRHNNPWFGPFVQITAAAACAPAGPAVAAACEGAVTSVDALFDGQPIGRALEGGAITFAEAYAFNQVGSLTGGGGIPCCDNARFFENVAGHALVGGTFNVIQGGNFGPGALSAGFSGAVGPYIGGLGLISGTAVSAATGGVASILGGGKFENGAVTGAFGYIFNQVAHIQQDLQRQCSAGSLSACTAAVNAQGGDLMAQAVAQLSGASIGFGLFGVAVVTTGTLDISIGTAAAKFVGGSGSDLFSQWYFGGAGLSDLNYAQAAAAGGITVALPGPLRARPESRSGESAGHAEAALANADTSRSRHRSGRALAGQPILV